MRSIVRAGEEVVEEELESGVAAFLNVRSNFSLDSP
jgi:hypothetical protein